MRRSRRVGPVPGSPLVFAFLVLWPSLTVMAQQPGESFSLQMTVEKQVTVNEGGSPVVKRAPLAEARVGDVLVYTVAYANEGSAEVSGAYVTVPVPPGTACMPDSAAGEGCEVTFSTDGGEAFQKPPVKCSTTRPDGTVEERPASPEDLTHIRWRARGAVAPGQSRDVTFTVRVLEQRDKQKIALGMTAEKETRQQVDGKWVVVRAPLEKAGRGDTICYTVAYSNEGLEPVKEVTVVDPVPAGTVYVPASAIGEGTEITYSVDGGHLYQLPPVMQVARGPDGTRTEKEATADQYTHVKWVVQTPVLPGESGRVSFKVKVQ